MSDFNNALVQAAGAAGGAAVCGLLGSVVGFGGSMCASLFG